MLCKRCSGLLFTLWRDCFNKVIVTAEAKIKKSLLQGRAAQHLQQSLCACCLGAAAAIGGGFRKGYKYIVNPIIL
jgi:hypothetical protein